MTTDNGRYPSGRATHEPSPSSTGLGHTLSVPNADRLKRAAYELWRLLDDIDTADDIAKADDVAFRTMARRYQRMRFDFLTGEEWDALHDEKFG